MLVGEDGTVLGRFNLFELEHGTARLGYRVAQHVAGRGVATAAGQELCRLAAAKYGLRTLRAAAARQNVASQRVLAKAGSSWLARLIRPASAVGQAPGISVRCPPADSG